MLELNWNQRCRDKTKLNTCHHMLTSSTQVQNKSIHENVYLTPENEKCTCEACKIVVFHCQICKFVTFLLPSSSWLLKLPIISSHPSFDHTTFFFIIINVITVVLAALCILKVLGSQCWVSEITYKQQRQKHVHYHSRPRLACSGCWATLNWWCVTQPDQHHDRHEDGEGI